MGMPDLRVRTAYQTIGWEGAAECDRGVGHVGLDRNCNRNRPVLWPGPLGHPQCRLVECLGLWCTLDGDRSGGVVVAGMKDDEGP